MLVDEYLRVKLKNISTDIRKNSYVACNMQSLTDYYLKRIIVESELEDHINAINHFKRIDYIKKQRLLNKKILLVTVDEKPIQSPKKDVYNDNKKNKTYDLKLKKIVE